MAQDKYTTSGINLRNSRIGAKRLLGLGNDQTVANESSRIQPVFRRNRKYRVTNLSDPGPDRQRKSLWANTIATKIEYQSIGSIALQAANPATPYKIAPARTIVAEMIDHPIGLIGRGVLHSHVIGEMYDNPKDDRVVEAEKYARTFDDVLSLLKSRLDKIVFSGDINLRQGTATPEWLSIYEVARKHGLRVLQISPIDFMFYTPSLKLESHAKLPKARFDTDHDGVRATFKAA